MERLNHIGRVVRQNSRPIEHSGTDGGIVRPQTMLGKSHRQVLGGFDDGVRHHAHVGRPQALLVQLIEKLVARFRKRSPLQKLQVDVMLGILTPPQLRQCAQSERIGLYRSGGDLVGALPKRRRSRCFLHGRSPAAPQEP
jgi:hypothetical protein